jgi:signal transduction histidine kinase/DNA-binding response OmpR family regulator
MENIKKLIKKYILSEEIPLDARILNMVCAFGLLAAFTATIARIIEQVPLITLFSMIGIFVSILLLMLVSNCFHLYRISTWITLIALGDIFFPIVFFTNGGVESGMAAYFTLSIVIIFLLVRGLSCVLILSSHIVIVLVCYIISFVRPGLVLQMNAFQLYVDNIQSFLVAGFFIGFVIKFQDRLYLHEKRKKEDSAVVLERQDRLLHVINDAAAALLTLDVENFKEALQNGMGMMAACVSVDRIYIWRICREDGVSGYSTVYEWTARGELRQNLQSYPFSTSLPRWEKLLSDGSCINGSLSSLPPDEQECLKPFGMRSILAIPVFFQETFWGFVSFDDCKRERNFSGDETSILRSGSLLLANAVIRNEMLEEMRQADRLRRTTNSAATILFNSGVDEFEKDMRECIGMMARCVNADQALIRMNEMRDGELYAKVIYQWPEEAGGDGADAGLSYRRDLPGWEAALADGQIIREMTRKLSPAEQETFSRFSIVSCLAIPIFSLERFWGFISFNYRHKEREFSSNEEAILRSGGILIANAISRNGMTKSLVQAREEALSSTRAKSNFLANMSHEMRTPMNAIIGMTNIARSSPDPEKKDLCLSKIDDASMHLLGVINDVLDMSKIEADKFELSVEPFDFEKALQKVVNVINFRVDEKKQVLSVHIDRHIPKMLVGDDQRLVQVITNLLSNAVKFTPEGGAIDLDTWLEEEEGETCTIKIQVKDSGIGISPDQQARLFTSFQQAENTTTRKFGGTGLGLAISKRIVEMMGGGIWVRSKLNEGSTFGFTFQVKRGAETRKNLLKEGVNRSNLRILAVDDDEDTRYCLTDFLRLFALQGDVAAGAGEALDLIQKNGPYDICFVDWKMPGMDGIELSRRIRAGERENTSHKSVIILISSGEWSAIEGEAHKAGVDRFLSKPLFPSSMAEIINDCLEEDTEPMGEGAAPRDNFKGFRLLLAEDLEINQEIVLALLEPMELVIDCVENGAEALDKFSKDPDAYDMIFMDVQMPEMDGYEATRRIRAFEDSLGASADNTEPASADNTKLASAGNTESAGGGQAPAKSTKHIPIVAMTANVFRQDIEQCLAAGMDDHVGKPLDFEEVLVKLRKYLHQGIAGNAL